jgi:hypothetical protein
MLNRPGDYLVGSLESRIAARALLKSRSEIAKKWRFVVETLGKPVSLEKSTCVRKPCVATHGLDGPLIIEIVCLGGADLTETRSEQLEAWIRRLPVDGRRYRFAD